jgi:hypothetical protein
MQTQLKNWSLKLDLERATNEERISWRRSYTMNWLYDLVNICSAIIVKRNTMKGEGHVYEEVNWPTTGPWHHHRRLFALSEFASDITTLPCKSQALTFGRGSCHTMFYSSSVSSILSVLPVVGHWILSVVMFWFALHASFDRDATLTFSCTANSRRMVVVCFSRLMY